MRVGWVDWRAAYWVAWIFGYSVLSVYRILFSTFLGAYWIWIDDIGVVLQGAQREALLPIIQG
jgi:hypothetical protein